MADVFGGRGVCFARLQGGAGGRVFRVDFESAEGARSVCVKLVRDRRDPLFSDESLENRVYGGRPGHYDAARAALEGVVPVPKLFASGRVVGAADAEGDPSLNTRWRYWIMQKLEGMSVVDWTQEAQHDPLGLYRLIGQTLARMHGVERDYPGWVDLPEADRWSWGPALFHTLRDAVDRAAVASELIAAGHAELREFVGREEARWTDPSDYHLSHPDGLQGIARHDGSTWRLCGAVDLEDHLYTDARFPLSGVDLQARLRGPPLPGAFREGYSSPRPWPSGFEEVRPVYQVLFLCTWTHVLGDPPGLAEVALEIARSAA